MFGVGAVLGDSLEPYTASVTTFDRAQGTGANNYGRYSNKEFDAAIKSASRTLNEKEREELQRKAARIAAEDVALIPVHNAKAAWRCRSSARGSAAPWLFCGRHSPRSVPISLLADR